MVKFPYPVKRGVSKLNSWERVSTPAIRIREAMDRAGKKQIDLVNETGLQKSAISRYISGEYEPKQTALYKMGKVLDVSEMWLAGYDIPMERPQEQKNNDAIADIVVRLRTDEKFLSAVKKIYSFAPDKLDSFLHLLE